jgi:lipoprotein NlpI
MAVVLASPAWAASQRDRHDCEANDPDRSIAACTRILQGRGETAQNRAMAYNNRGIAWRLKGEYDRAMADYNEAIRLDPKYANAYNNRASAWSEKGDFDRAIGDYSEAIRLNPKYADAYYNRAVAWRDKGDLDKAIADYSEVIRLDPKDATAFFNRAIASFFDGSIPKAVADFSQASELDPKDPYAALWLHIVNQRSNLISHLAQATGQLDMTKWPAPLIRLFLGQLTQDAVLAAANDPDAKKKQGQVCEANFYSGELALMQGAKENATDLFRLAAANCPDSHERWAANAELKSLGLTPQSRPHGD